jgi:hypothetical protein
VERTLVAIKTVAKFYILDADRQLTNAHSIVKGAVTHRYVALPFIFATEFYIPIYNSSKGVYLSPAPETAAYYGQIISRIAALPLRWLCYDIEGDKQLGSFKPLWDKDKKLINLL